MELFASAPGLAVEESYVRLLNHLPGLAYRCRVGRTDPIVSERLEYTLEFVSKGSYDLLGIPAEDMVRNNNNTIERMMHPDDLQKTRRNMYDSIVAHQPYQVMYRVSLPSGRLKWIWDQGEGVFDADGELRYLEGLMMDISEQKFQELELKEENRQRKASVSNLYGLGNIVGKSEAMRRVYGLILKAAETDTNVIIYGETGSGKDLVAKAIHEYSARKGNYVPVNCGAIPESLMESELFGYVEGAFTGTSRGGKMGLFEQAHGGTLFLDEIGELPPHIQSKLLQLIQEKTIERVSGTKRIELDFRLLVATNRNLEEEVQRGLFRSDLFYRLNVIRVHIPPLRQRPEDILPMAHQFLERFCKEYGKQLALSPRFVAFLEQYPWPGNVRQLENLMERLVITAQNPILDITALPLEYNSGGSAPDLPSQEGTLAERMDAFEGQIIRDSYRRCGTTVAVAKELGISQATAVRKIAKYVKDRKE